MSFRKINSGEENIDTQIVIWVHRDREQLLADMHHPMETATYVGQPLEKIVDLAVFQRDITPGTPEVVVIDEQDNWPATYRPLVKS